MNGEHLQELVEKVRVFSDAGARDTALELVQGVLTLHREALERMMDLVASSAEGPGLCEKFGGDVQVSAVLLLHDLHPLDLETRVRNMLVRFPAARLLSVVDGTVRIEARDPRLEVPVRAALQDAAPDAAEIVVEGIRTSFVPLSELLAAG